MANSLKQRKYFFIYKTTNLINGKYYIGMHTTSNLKDGYLGSGTRLRRSIRKHGKENFKCEILEFLKDREELIKKEKEIVTEEVLKDVLCMNLRIGGLGGFSQEQIKQSNIIRRKKFNKKIQEDENFKERYKQALSKGLKKYFEKNLGKFKGKQHTEESKLKQSLSHKGKGLGKDNSQYGTCWITKEGVSKKIKKEELIPQGWVLGRKEKRISKFS